MAVYVVSFDQDIGSWDVLRIDAPNMHLMFDGATSLSDCHKVLIQASFEAQTYAWPYSWGSLPPCPPPPPGTFGGKPALQAAVDLWCTPTFVRHRKRKRISEVSGNTPGTGLALQRRRLRSRRPHRCLLS